MTSQRYVKKRDTVSDYMTSVPTEVASRLRAIRKIVTETAPGAVEGISYGMPAYTLYGKPLVYFAAFKNHIGFYALPSTQVAFKKALETYKTSKGTVQFQHDEPLPRTLIKKIVMFRAKENRIKRKE